MLRSIANLLECSVQGEAGSLAMIEDALIDLRQGKITYLLLRPRLSAQRGSVASTAVLSVDADNRVIRIALKGTEAHPAEKEPAARPRPESVCRLLGYGVQASDGDAGRISDLLVDDGDWMVRDAVIALGSSGKSVRIAFRDLQGYDPANHRCRIARSNPDLLKESERPAA